MFGSTLDRIDSYKIDSSIIDFERIDLCLDNVEYVVWIVLIKIAFKYIITKMDINRLNDHKIKFV
jgi:hypothetical protein